MIKHVIVHRDAIQDKTNCITCEHRAALARVKIVNGIPILYLAENIGCITFSKTNLTFACGQNLKLPVNDEGE